MHFVSSTLRFLVLWARNSHSTHRHILPVSSFQPLDLPDQTRPDLGIKVCVSQSVSQSVSVRPRRPRQTNAKPFSSHAAAASSSSYSSSCSFLRCSPGGERENRARADACLRARKEAAAGRGWYVDCPKNSPPRLPFLPSFLPSCLPSSLRSPFLGWSRHSRATTTTTDTFLVTSRAARTIIAATDESAAAQPLARSLARSRARRRPNLGEGRGRERERE